MIITTLRPTAVVTAGGASAVPSGTLATVTADNNDATYILQPGGAGRWSVRVEPHPLGAGYERHQVRARARMRVNAGVGREDLGVSIGTNDTAMFSRIFINDVMTEYAGNWTSIGLLNLDDPGTKSDLNITGGYLTLPSGGANQTLTAELYLDVDARLEPQFSPEIRDNAGVNQWLGTITDTNQPEVYFGPASYDGLPPNRWTFELVKSPGTIVYQTEGAGEPPNAFTLPIPLDDGNYTATYGVSSTIRGTDEFFGVEVLNFAIQNTIPPPSPPNLTTDREGDGYRLTWSFAGGQPFDDGYVVAEVWRDDCTGSQRIAVVPDGLEGSYLDLAIPQIDTEHVLVGGVCTLELHGCEITYRVRYWGYVSTTVEIPDSIPVDLVLGWPGTAGSIPSGWLRVTALDGFYPRGTTTTGVPSATGGAATHTHTTPNHTHSIPSHQHMMPADTTGNSAGTNTERKNNNPIAVTSTTHDHTLPLLSGGSNVVQTSAAAPGTTGSSNLPPTREVIWIRSDGSATVYPIGALGWSTQSVSGWTTDTASSGRFLRGAPAAGNGGATYGSSRHSHTVNAHTHTTPQHDHPNFTTGLSGPAAANEANSGGTNPRWLARHTHPGNVVANTSGALPSATGGTTGDRDHEPVNRRLRTLRNTGNGAQTRIIGLYTDAIADLDPVLTWCNGANGTPDMRTWFCRDIGPASVGSTGGATSHNHTVASHVHPATSHTHEITIGQSGGRDYGRDTSGTQGTVPTETHTHNSSDTQAALVTATAGGSGTSGSATSLPPYREVHFVRVEGIVAGGDLPVPELRISEFSSITVPALLHTDGMDRIGSLAAVMAVAATRGHALPRLSTDSVPVTGGRHTVSNTVSGEDLTLTIGVLGKQDIDALEEIMASDRIYWAPLGGTPGWFAPGPWTVAGPAPDVKVLTVTAVRQPWPSTPDPEDYL